MCFSLKYYFIYIYIYIIMTETNNIVQPKQGRGRPKKYFTEEERKHANNRYTKKCMESNPLSKFINLFKTLIGPIRNNWESVSVTIDKTIRDEMAPILQEDKDVTFGP